MVSPGSAEDWPSRPVRIVAPFAPGGTADTLGRVAAEHLSEAFGQQFFVENRAGAGGTTGSLAVARMDPDGYNFVVSGIATHAIAPATNPNIGYDALKDFTHVAYFGGPPIVFIVPAKLGVKSLRELIDYAKSRNEKLTYASPGVGTSGHLVAEYFAGKAGIAIEHIPYRGAAPGVMDVVAGHLRFGSMTWSILTPDVCAHWDGHAVSFMPGVAKSEAPTADRLEETWRRYYASIFNPARLKVQAMQKEMPRKYWRNLPEALLIKPLIESAERTASAMIANAATEPHKPQKRLEPPTAGDEADDMARRRADDIERLREEAARFGARRFQSDPTSTNAEGRRPRFFNPDVVGNSSSSRPI